MPRRRRGTRIPDPVARNVAGRLCYASAAEALGGLYGSTSLERALGFTPAARARQHAPSCVDAASSGRPKCSLPTGTCKKWLHGHVVSDQTLALIAKTKPRIATLMREARDSDLVRALSIASSDHRFVGRQLCALSEEAFGNYLGCMALGRRNPIFAARLSEDLLHRGMEGSGMTMIIAVIGLDRQLSYPRSAITQQHLEKAFAHALENVAKVHPVVAFARCALAEYWAQRTCQPRPPANSTSNVWKSSVIVELQKRESSRPVCANSGCS